MINTIPISSLHLISIPNQQIPHPNLIFHILASIIIHTNINLWHNIGAQVGRSGQPKDKQEREDRAYQGQGT
jgi:hypothetical protein